MNPNLKHVWKQMLSVGLGALGHANYLVTYYRQENAHWSDLSVLMAAHAGELLIKARIAVEHPLLIFSDLPKAKKVNGLLDLEHLFRDGRTILWKDLPETLWATTGYAMPGREVFEEFGRIRNGIQHFGPYDGDPQYASARFIYGVIDPILYGSWRKHAISYFDDCFGHECLHEMVTMSEIEFTPPPHLAKEYVEDGPEFGPRTAYWDAMKKRAQSVLDDLEREMKE